jgi:hypothetical protein
MKRNRNAPSSSRPAKGDSHLALTTLAGSARYPGYERCSTAPPTASTADVSRLRT